MGRRILADAVRGDHRRTMVARPNAAAKILKIPEPNADNDGPTGFFGVADIVRSRQEVEIEVEHSGDYIDHYRDQGARFVFTPDQLWDDGDSDVVGAFNPLGGESSSVPVFTQTLMTTGHLVQLGSPKMIELEKWGKYTTTRGISGLLGAVRWTGSPNAPVILFWTLDEHDDHGGSPLMSYQWDYDAGRTFTCHYAGANLSSTTMPAFDMIEMDDGSIVLAVVTNDEVVVYKSFDCGENWEGLAQWAVTSTTWKIAVDRIGSRIVLCISNDPGGGGGNAIFSYYSDDGGVSWSSATVVQATAGAQTVIDIDMQMDQNGRLYLLYVTDQAGNDRATYAVTTDGINWSTGNSTSFIPTGPLSFCQQYFGRWLMYASDLVGFEHIYERHTVGNNFPYVTTPVHSLSGGVAVNERAGDADGCDFEELCAREFFDGGFVDVVAMVHDDHDATEYWNLVVYRLAMWSGVQFDQAINSWDAVWTPHAYPSTNDPHPNLNIWTEAQAGAGAVALGSENDFNHLEITSGAGADVKTYRYPAAGSDGAWDDGLTARFELKVVSGYGKVNFRLTSAPSNEDTNFTLQFQTDRVILWDENAGLGADVIVPTDWDPSTWNEYLVIAKENEVQVFRSPSGTYREIAHYEEILSYDTLQDDPYAAAGDNRVMWGVSNALGSLSGTSEIHWRTVMALEDEAFDVDWDFSAPYGKKCHYNPVGLFQGIACKWDGDFAVDGDTWELNVGAHYDADNILLASPRLRWAEPVRDPLSAASADANFEWQRQDDDGQCMNMVFNAVAVFGMNHWRWRLYGQSFGGGGDTELFDVDADSRGSIVHDGVFKVDTSYPDQDAVRVDANTTAWDGEFVPNQYASDGMRNFYVCFTSGTCDDCVYKIVANDEDTLYLECNVEADGVAADDTFIIFTDRCLVLLPSTYRYPRVQFNYRINGFTPSPDDAQFRLGTVVLGMLYVLPNDEWDFSMRTEPAVNVEEGRGQHRQFRELGPERRLIDLAYTGTLDEGMGVHSTRELYRFLRWGVNPVVWIDDDTVFQAVGGVSGDPFGHVDPILAQVRGPVSQNHKAYDYVQKDGVWRVRNYLDMQGVTLEEVL
jgi:hypothetical protein